MNLGYSLLLGEYIEAERVEYDDCKPFQITCPACHEPVFKVVRAVPGSERHYLSHYEVSQSYATDCELRVRSLTHAEIEKSNSLARGQRLALFLSVLKTSVQRYELATYGPRATVVLGTVRRNKALKLLRRIHFDHVRQTHGLKDRHELLAFCNDYIQDFSQGHPGFVPTTFSLEVQKRIAVDIWLHLLTSHGQDNFFYLFNFCYLFLMSRLDEAAATRSLQQWESALFDTMALLTKANTKNGGQLISLMARTKIPSFEGEIDLTGKLLAEITHEMLGCLLRLPYSEILSDELAKRDKRRSKQEETKKGRSLFNA